MALADGPKNIREKVHVDVEATVVPIAESVGFSASLDANLVTWNGPDDPENPKNWSTGKRWTATLIVSSFTFLSPLSGTMISPAIGAIGSDLDISSSFEMQIVLSVVLLGIGFGPLILAPISEIKGRVPVLLLGNLFFLAWNVGCGFARTNTQLTIFRFLSGIGASAPLAIGGGVISDLWKPEERGKAMAVYTFGPLLGPALGPIAGGYITQRTTWRWVFWGVSIADCGLQIFALLFLHETYAPKILAKKARHLRRRTEDQTYHTEHEDPDKTLLKLIQNNLSRPLRMLGNQPVVQILALQMAILYGVMYMVLFTFPLLWTDIYHQSISRGSLNYISTGIGFILGSQIAGPLNDRIYTRLKRHNNNHGLPEHRIPLLLPGTLLLPLGLLLYGWTAHFHTHPLLPNLGAALFCAGTIVCFQAIQTYTIDAYERYAASATSTLNVAKSLTGFAFPLLAPEMYRRLGWGWGNVVLAAGAAAGAGVGAGVLWLWGARLRARGGGRFEVRE